MYMYACAIEFYMYIQEYIRGINNIYAWVVKIYWHISLNIQQCVAYTVHVTVQKFIAMTRDDQIYHMLQNHENLNQPRFGFE